MNKNKLSFIDWLKNWLTTESKFTKESPIEITLCGGIFSDLYKIFPNIGKKKG